MSYKDFKQTDAKWKGNYYSGYTISSQGCGPTSIADVVYDLDPTITPAKTAKWMEDNGCSCHGSGTYYSGMVKALKHYGYEAEQLNYTTLYGKSNSSIVTDFIKKIKSGKYVGIACMGKSIWTTSGHYVFVKVIKNNRIYINDPYNTRADCMITTRGAWEPYIKYLFLIKKPTMYVKTVGIVNKRKKAAGLTKSNFLGRIEKGTRLAIDKTQGKYYHVMCHDVWIKKSKYFKVTT